MKKLKVSLGKRTAFCVEGCTLKTLQMGVVQAPYLNPVLRMEVGHHDNRQCLESLPLSVTRYLLSVK